MAWLIGHRNNLRFWRQLPLGASLLFFCAVFCLFASFGFIGIGPRGSWLAGVANAIFSGGIATLFAYLGTRGHSRWLLAAAVFFLVAWPRIAPHIYPKEMAAPVANLPAEISAIGLVVGGYLLMLFFIGTEGRRYYRLNTEIELAGEIHRALAPPLAARIGGFEFAGSSRPSGAVGGDLLDLIETPTGWLAYIADVSGHGVAAGVLMGLVKSAVRTALTTTAASGDGLVPAVNRVLAGIMPPEKFVTFAGVSGDGGAELKFVAAGQPPLLHFHAADSMVSHCRVENLPLGLFAEAGFGGTKVSCAPGDVLALFTDGCTELFDAEGREMGLDGLAQALANCARRPLGEAAAAMTAAIQQFGPQTDDQTLLLVRAANV